jgi:outer membrane immunogenic protein
MTGLAKTFMPLQLLVCALLLAPGGAQAADMPLKAPIVAPVYGWGGFYIGINAGYSWGPWDSNSAAAIFSTASTTASPKVDGWLVGAQAGYNWQISPRWLLGVEADYQYTWEKASDAWGATLGPIPFQDGLLTATTASSSEWKFPWFATFRARAGYVLDSWLLYITGGAAVGRAQFATTSTATLVLTGPSAFTATTTVGASESVTKWGWTVGGGIEKSLTGNLSAKLEYLYVDLGNHTFLAGTGFDTDVKLQDHIVRLGLNYRFAPISVRY